MKTEAKFQAAMDTAARLAFPWLRDGDFDIEHVIRVQAGRGMISADGQTNYKKHGRADLVLNQGGRPLAVIELKRPDIGLTDGDGAQGLSYARLLQPMAPLVVVTDGAAVRFIDTYSGQPWAVGSDAPDENAVQARFSAAATVAAGARENAIAALLGPTSDVWTTMLRTASAAALAERSGDWTETLQPFVRGFLIPRRATLEVRHELADGTRLVFVTGDPLAGTSNVLRELVEATASSTAEVVLYLEAGGRSGGLLERLSVLLEAELGWPATVQEVRTWLKTVSHATGPRLVLAVDGLPRQSDAALAELETLITAPFGANVRVVLAVEPGIAEGLARDATGRSASAIGRASRTVRVPYLDDEEVEGAAQALLDHHVGLSDGYALCRDYRTPWVLRALGGAVNAQSSDSATATLIAAVPAVLGLRLFVHVRAQWSMAGTLRADYADIARALLKDVKRGGGGAHLALERTAVFAVRRKTLREVCDADTLRELKARGALREAVVAGEKVFIPLLPELLASELAIVLGEGLARELSRDPDGAADWLTGRTSRVAMGDLIGAQAILDATQHTRDLPLSLIEDLLSARPRTETLPMGSRALVRIPGAEALEITFVGAGEIELRHKSRVQRFEVDEDEGRTTYADLESWSILAHLASRPMGLVDAAGQIAERADPILLFKVGSSPIPMVKPPHDGMAVGVHMHDLPNQSIVCHANGVCEPITQSIMDYLGDQMTEADPWLKAAAASGRTPLLNRIDIALRGLEKLSETALREWAHKARSEVIAPALRASLASAFETKAA